MPIWVAWLIAAGILGVGEVLTLAFVLSMFSIGAVAAAAVAGAGGGGMAQGLTFAAVSFALLLVVRPIARRHMHGPPSLRTGADALVGRKATTVTAVDPHGGQVKIGGEVWSARSYDGHQAIPAGAQVEVLAIEGATALVYSVESP